MKNIKKKKVHKNIGGVLFFLSALSVFSVGFASWNINENNTTETALAIEADTVLNAEDFFKFQSIEMFEISKYGLVVDDAIVYQGDVKIPFYIIVKDGIYPYLTQNSLSLDLYLKSTDEFNLLSEDYLGSTTPIINYSASPSYSSFPDTSNTAQGTLDNNSIQVNIQYQNDNLANISLLYFTIVYHFDFSTYADTFETAIYNQIPDNGIGLNFQIGVNSL